MMSLASCNNGSSPESIAETLAATVISNMDPAVDNTTRLQYYQVLEQVNISWLSSKDDYSVLN